MEANGDAERSRWEALSIAQSKLLVPVVSALQKDRPWAKLKGPPPPVTGPAAGLRQSPPPGQLLLLILSSLSCAKLGCMKRMGCISCIQCCTLARTLLCTLYLLQCE